MRRFASFALVAALAALGACSLINAPDEVKPGGTGGGGGASSSASSSSHASSSSSATSSSSGGLTCTVASDCKMLDDMCGVGVCLNGMCQKMAQNDGKACDDGLFCTDGETCQGGTCMGATPHCAPPSDPCKIATCDEAGKTCGVMEGNDGKSCDDGDPCTSGDSCFAGACKSGGPTDCSGLTTSCSVGSCMPGVGCVASNINEGLACNINNVCAKSQCITGKCTPTSLFNGTPCDDGQFCTINDVCQNAVCSGSPRVCPGATNCQTASCDEAGKTCKLTPIADGTMCDDNNACTFGTTCKGGTCTPAGTIMSCVSNDKCCPAGCNHNNDLDCP